MSIAEKVTTIAENQEKVYDAGYEKGKLEGGAGDSWYDTFWDSFQDNGNPDGRRYSYAFYYWNRDMFYPKYDIKCINNMAGLFQFFEQNGSVPFDLSARLKECGVVLDTSKATTGAAYSFYYTSFSKIPTVDFTGITDLEKLTYAFANNGHLVEIEKVICKETNVWHVTFAGCPKLEKITIEGVIGQNGLDMRPCPKLTHDSMINDKGTGIINCLKDYSDDTSGTQWVVQLGATNLGKLTEAEIAIATEKGWSLT